MPDQDKDIQQLAATHREKDHAIISNIREAGIFFNVSSQKVLSELADTATKDVQQTGAKLLAHKETFYVNAASQSRQSFFLACIVGLIGLALIIVAVLIGLFTDKVVVSGSLAFLVYRLKF